MAFVLLREFQTLLQEFLLKLLLVVVCVIRVEYLHNRIEIFEIERQESKSKGI